MLALTIAKSLLTAETRVQEGRAVWPAGASEMDITQAVKFTLHAAIEYGVAISGDDLNEACQRVRDELPRWAGQHIQYFNQNASLAQVHALLDRAIVGSFA